MAVVGWQYVPARQAASVSAVSNSSRSTMHSDGAWTPTGTRLRSGCKIVTTTLTPLMNRLNFSPAFRENLRFDTVLPSMVVNRELQSLQAGERLLRPGDIARAG